MFPSRSALPKTVGWRSCVVMVLASTVLTTVSLGPMASALGSFSPVVWTGTALVGAAQCALLAELTSCFPGRAGGTAQYAHRTLARGSPLLGAVSSWSYWVAWTPGIAVSLILAAEYLGTAVGTDADRLAMAAALGAVLYALNACGLRVAVLAGALAGVVALVPLAAILLSPLLVPGAFHLESVTSLSIPGPPLDAGEVVALVAKWAFVAAWASYGAEMASTLVAEVRDSTAMPRVMAGSAVATLAGYCAIPVVMVGLVGASGLSGDAHTAFLRPAEMVFGDHGRMVVGVMLAAALILSAQAFIVASSRTIYQLARDGHLPSLFARTSVRGVPIGSIACDSVVIAVMLSSFGSDVVNVVAAANVGYLVVFVLLPIAYLRLRAHPPESARAFRLGRSARPLACTLATLNVLLLVVGGWQWGAQVMLTGGALTLLIIPISWATRRRPPEMPRT